MNILLIHGYFLKEDAEEQKIMMPYPPQGLLHLNTYLTLKGISSYVFDTTFSSFDELTAYIKENSPGFLGIYCNLVTRVNIMKIIRFIKNEDVLNNTVIIAGGPDVRYHAEDYISGGADFCVIGEGEETIRELIMCLEEGISDLSVIQGIAYRKNGGDVITTRERPLIKNIDNLPFPDFEVVPLHRYFNTWKNNHGFTSITVSTMRGCPYSCKWCSKAVYGNSYRRRSPEVVVKELARLNEKYHPDKYWFVDDVFTISNSWLEEFFHQLRNTDLKISYECITRADKMDADTIHLLKESGCFRVWIGGESGSQKVLDRMDRRVTAVQVRDMITMSKKAGLATGTFLMLGYPGETIEDIDETLNHLKLAAPDQFTLTLAYPIKGTAFYEEIESSVKVPGSNQWGEYSDWELDFNRTYRSGFYKHAIRFINHQMAAYSYKTIHERLSLLFIKHWLTAQISRTLMSLYNKTGELS